MSLAQEKKCNVCGTVDSSFFVSGKDRLHKTDEKIFTLEKCSSCGLVYMYPQPSVEELQKYYPDNYGPYHESSQVLKYGPLSRLIKKIAVSFKKKPLSPEEMPKDMSVKRLLDFGCGSGAYLERMRNLHPKWELVGFDNSEYACNQTKAKGFEVLSGDLITADIPPASFDIVYLSHVIEHLNDPKKTVEKIYTILKPGGEVIIVTPNVDSIAAKVFGTYWFGLDAPRHLFLFTPKILSRLLTDVGFKIKEASTVSDVRVEIGSLNYMFPRNDMRINFIVWHILRAILMPFGKFFSYFKKTSIMTVRGIKQ